MDLDKDNFQIILENILQMSNGICSFYDHAKIRDLNTGNEEYVNEELADFFAASDLIISRAGAGSIFELLALAKPNLLMPLTKKASRGDQILNAESFEKQGFSLVIDEDTISKEGLLSALVELEVKAEEMTRTMKQTNLTKANDNIIKVIEEELYL